MVRARAAGCGVFMVLCGELLVAGSVACELVLVRRCAAALLVVCPVFLDVCAAYCSSWRSLPSHGLGLVIALRGGGRAVPPERHRRAWDRRDGAHSCGGAGDVFFHQQGQHEPRLEQHFQSATKTPATRASNEPARVDAPGRASSKAERRRRDRASREALSEEQLWPALWFRGIKLRRGPRAWQTAL